MCAEARMTNLEGLDEVRELARARSQRNYQEMANVYSKALLSPSLCGGTNGFESRGIRKEKSPIPIQVFS